ncbi:MAG: hypothetical protein ABJL55_15730 [Roseibium sp.]
MNIRVDLSVTAFVSAIAIACLLYVPASANELVPPEIAKSVSDDEIDRYSLVSVDDDILRVDRQNGTVSVCRQINDAWRCNPVPLAEDAYLAEIAELAAEVDRLTKRLKENQGPKGGGAVPVPPGAATDRPEEKSETTKPSSSLSTEDEKELDKVLDFTEGAMRRFFGMVRELQQDMEGSGN